MDSVHSKEETVRLRTQLHDLRDKLTDLENKVSKQCHQNDSLCSCDLFNIAIEYYTKLTFAIIHTISGRTAKKYQAIIKHSEDSSYT